MERSKHYLILKRVMRLHWSNKALTTGTKLDEKGPAREDAGLGCALQRLRGRLERVYTVSFASLVNIKRIMAA
jgi:hypothetical protein